MIVVDTGVILAVADAGDGDHDRCDELLGSYPGVELIVPTTVIVECSWLIEDRLGPAAEAAFLRSVLSGELTRVDLAEGDWVRAVELVETYADRGLGLVDASIVAVAEWLRIATVATLNRRDFTVVRPATWTCSNCSPDLASSRCFTAPMVDAPSHKPAWPCKRPLR